MSEPTAFNSLFLVPSRNGLTKPKRVRGSGVKMVNMGELFAHARIRSAEMDRVPLGENERSFLLAPGDLLFARQSLVLSGAGKCSIFLDDEEDVCFESHIIRVRIDRAKADPQYLFYFFQSPDGRNAILSIVEQGAGVAGIRGSDLANLVLRMPPLAVQTEVAQLLSQLDDKIDLNRRTIQTLEAMAQAIFRDWFIDFGPVRRKIEGATDPITVMAGLSLDDRRAAALATLFPDRLVKEERPEGWCAGALDTVAATVGETVRPAALPQETPYIGLEHMPRRSLALDEWAAVGKVTSQKTRFKRGQILFGKLRPYFHKVGLATLDGVCSTDIVVLDSKLDFDRELIACCVSSEAFVAFTDQGSTGTKMPRTSWSVMKTYPLAVADEPVRRAFSEIVRPLHQKIIANVTENRTLAETRDHLLPRLMSGEVQVRDVSEFAEATAA